MDSLYKIYKKLKSFQEFDKKIARFSSFPQKILGQIPDSLFHVKEYFSQEYMSYERAFKFLEDLILDETPSPTDEVFHLWKELIEKRQFYSKTPEYLKEIFQSIVMEVYLLAKEDVLSSALTIPVKEMMEKIENFLDTEEKTILANEICFLEEILEKNGWNGESFSSPPNVQQVASRMKFLVTWRK